MSLVLKLRKRIIYDFLKFCIIYCVCAAGFSLCYAEKITYVISDQHDIDNPHYDNLEEELARLFMNAIFADGDYELDVKVMPIMRLYKAIKLREIENWVTGGIRINDIYLFPELKDEYYTTTDKIFTESNCQVISVKGASKGSFYKVGEGEKKRVTYIMHPEMLKSIARTTNKGYLELSSINSIPRAVKFLLAGHTDYIVTEDIGFYTAMYSLGIPREKFMLEPCPPGYEKIEIILYIDSKMPEHIKEDINNNIKKLYDAGVLDQVRKNFLERYQLIQPEDTQGD